MKHAPVKLEHGDIHNTMLLQATDTVASTEDMPPLMYSMLTDEGWRVLVRPADGKKFENKTLADWVLGPPWAGLKFHNWATLYGILRCNVEWGRKCIDKLQEYGAPPEDKAKRELESERAEKTPLPRNGEIGGGHESRFDNIKAAKTIGGTSLEYTLRRLERDHPKLFAAYKCGEISANAAALAAGFRKKPLKRCPECGHEWR